MTLNEPEIQRERFERAAREFGVDLDEDKLKDALRKIAPERSAGASQAEAPAGATRGSGRRPSPSRD